MSNLFVGANMWLARATCTPQELLTHVLTETGAPPEELVRSDIVFFEGPAGGAVFSVGSITFCGCLPVNGYSNDVSTLLKNVLARFLDPTPFALGLV
eukprot:1196409-Prorocentrum_minimum.AAC.6